VPSILLRDISCKLALYSFALLWLFVVCMWTLSVARLVLESSECMEVTNEFVQRNWGKRGQVRPEEPVWRSGFELDSTWEQNTRVTAWCSLFRNWLWNYVISYAMNVATSWTS